MVFPECQLEITLVCLRLFIGLFQLFLAGIEAVYFGIIIGAVYHLVVCVCMMHCLDGSNESCYTSVQILKFDWSRTNHMPCNKYACYMARRAG